MSARLTMTVSGNVRWTNVRGFLPEVLTEVENSIPELNNQIVPQGKTGELRKSLKVEKTDRTIRLWWEASYAAAVDKGASESPGRYVPIIGKRLVNTKLTERQQVYRQARKEGFSRRAARAAFETPITFVEKEKLPKEAMGAFYARRAIGTTARGEKTLAAGGRHRVTGIADVQKRLPSYKRELTKRHELVHGVQWMGGRSFLETDSAALETEAEIITARAGGLTRNIGTHPGQKAQHFSERMVESLRVLAVIRTQEIIHRRLTS